MCRRFWLPALLLCLSGPAQAYTYVHVVLPGERLSQIAKRFHTTVKRIKRRNRLRGGRLRAGRKLRIVTSVPSRTRQKVRYRVAKRDTLSKIAKKFKMKLWLLKRLNRRALRRSLRIGQRLTVIVEGPRPKGGVRGLYQLTSGYGYKVRDTRRGWGTFLAVTRLHEVLSAHRRRFPGAPAVRVLDISRKGGGYFPPHGSHRRGRDVDIAYPKLPKYRKLTRMRGRMLDLKRTWFLLKTFIDTGDVTYVFIDLHLQREIYRYALKHGETKKSLKRIFQYPRRRATHGIIRNSRGHDTHMHVRFRPEKRRRPTS